MFKWFCKKDDVVQKEKIPPVEEEKSDTPEGISEPVVSFIKLFKTNHRRFRIENWTGYRFWITDKTTNEHFSLGFRCHDEYFNCLDSENTKWLTKQEKRHLYLQISEFYFERSVRLSKIKADRQRKRLMKVYANG